MRKAILRGIVFLLMLSPSVVMADWKIWTKIVGPGRTVTWDAKDAGSTYGQCAALRRMVLRSFERESDVQMNGEVVHTNSGQTITLYCYPAGVDPRTGR